MSDSDEDWFHKDIDKFVVEAPKNKDDGISIPHLLTGPAILNANFFADGLFIYILYRIFCKDAFIIFCLI